eukprot:TRINITY_DN32954_c0_g1_i2.p2 TRINITY_DN32954_c0_g1~~TRINITY_DN32954_c0_g1_i2.p2  ORF type:complete len:106 (-),score=14.98 TRINITY_DN32954_c0_g1_i2:480-797(-)
MLAQWFSPPETGHSNSNNTQLHLNAQREKSPSLQHTHTSPTPRERWAGGPAPHGNKGGHACTKVPHPSTLLTSAPHRTQCTSAHRQQASGRGTVGRKEGADRGEG